MAERAAVVDVVWLGGDFICLLSFDSAYGCIAELLCPLSSTEVIHLVV